MASRNRTHSRTSRTAIAFLGAAVAVGGGIYLHHHLKNEKQARAFALSMKAISPAVLDVKAQPRTPRNDGVLPASLITQTPMPGSSPPAPATPPVHTAPVAPSRAVAAAAVPAPAPIASAPTPVPASNASSSQTIAEAKAKMAADDLLGARTLLNDAYLRGRFNAADSETARALLSQISQTVFFSKTRFKDDPFQTVYQVQSGDRLARIADHHSVTWELLCRMNGMADARKLRSGQWIKIPNGPFNCVITKSAYRLDVYLGTPGEAGSLLITSMKVGLGKDNSTPTGQWLVQQGSKAHPATYYSPRGEGVIAADDPKNPLGGYWMGITGVSGNALSKDSYGIHGTIEPDSIGKQASMGCIRLGHDDIALLFDLLVDGKSKVIVRD